MIIDLKEIGILAADPNVEDLSMTLRWLRDMGLTRVSSATDGLGALIQLKKNPIQLAVMNWNLPRLSALDILAELRRIPRFSLPAVILTTDVKPEADLAQRATDQGIGGFLMKPYTARDLLRKVEATLGVSFGL